MNAIVPNIQWIRRALKAAAATMLVPLLDLPSKGDTAFPAKVPIDGHSYCVVNYSCPLEGADWPWLGGQLDRTNLYETVLSFPES